MTTITKEKTETANKPLKAAVQDILRMIEDFGALLRRETDALRQSDFRMVDLLQADKRTYARQYADMVTALSTRREEMMGLEVALRERLIKSRTSFTLILNENLRALEASKEGTRRLVDRILDTARKTLADDLQTNYSAKGQTQAYKTSTLSLKLDQNL